MDAPVLERGVAKDSEVPVEAGKDLAEFRNYEDSDRHDTVARHYTLMRTNQTLDFVQRMEKKFERPRMQMSVREAFAVLESYVDSSDPDSDHPNLEHMLQTAERIRRDGHPDWFVLTGLLHDMGKLCFHFDGTKENGMQGTADGDQWALGGDTFVVGCRLPDSLCMPHLNKLNPDMADERLSTELGIYELGCGLDSLHFAWGHDEYMYRVLAHYNKDTVTLPPQALAMIRYHSLYTWHTGGAYDKLMAPGDEDIKDWVLKFNTYDLYTKADAKPDVEALWPYYEALCNKYLPEKLWW